MQHYTPREELANALTHGVGIIFGMVALPLLIALTVAGGNFALMVAICVYGFSMLCMFSTSTLYHAIPELETKAVLRVLDHISIFLMIGGTYTPIVLNGVPQPDATWFLVIQWGIIAAGIVLKVFFTGRFRLLSSLLYLALGWMAVFVGKSLWASLSAWSLGWLFGGGLAYSLGVIFYQVRRIPYNHAIWHLFVLAATVAHYIAMLDIVRA